MSAEATVRELIARIDAAWRLKQFDGLEQCFHEDASIVGPGFVEYARGCKKCADSYIEFATNAEVVSYAESAHSLRIWEATALYTFSWEMTYRQKDGPRREIGTDQLVFGLGSEGWRLVWRHINFTPAAAQNAA